jgi:phage gp36-like protein
MMAYYSSVEDLKNYLPESQLVQTTDDNDTGAIDMEKLNDALRRAQNFIDAHLMGRYSLPPAVVPELIRDISTKLAGYFLMKRSLPLTLPEPIKLDYDYCIDQLVKMQRGQINPFPVANEPVFIAGNHVADDSVIMAATSNWGAWLS